MKLFNQILFGIILFTMFSCSKDPGKILPKKGGNWSVIYTLTEQYGNQPAMDTNIKLLMTFKQFTVDIYDNGKTITIPWTASKNQVTLFYPTDTIVYDVTKKTRTEEKWENTRVINVSGTTLTSSSTLDLTKEN